MACQALVRSAFQPTAWVRAACPVTMASVLVVTRPSSAGRQARWVELTPGALAAHGLPAGQGFTIGGLPTRWGGVEVAEAG
jgi:hypothetical protein